VKKGSLKNKQKNKTGLQNRLNISNPALVLIFNLGEGGKQRMLVGRVINLFTPVSLQKNLAIDENNVPQLIINGSGRKRKFGILYQSTEICRVFE